VIYSRPNDQIVVGLDGSQESADIRHGPSSQCCAFLARCLGVLMRADGYGWKASGWTVSDATQAYRFHSMGAVDREQALGQAFGF
jgi:hypothetical protein